MNITCVLISNALNWKGNKMSEEDKERLEKILEMLDRNREYLSTFWGLVIKEEEPTEGE